MTSPVDTSVKFFRDDFPGAPTLNGVIGSGISVLDACLNTGFGLRSAVSLVVSGGVATLTLSSDAKNINLLYSVVLVEGVTGSLDSLNGEQRITAATSTTLSFATAAADGTAAGTITVKTAPAGWEKRFTGTNKAVFRSLSPESLGMNLWVDDTNAQYMRVRGYETMDGVDSGTGLFPTLTDSSTGAFWKKSMVTNTATVRWDVLADARIVYFCPTPGYSQGTQYVPCAVYVFGDPIPYKSGDAFNSVLFGSALDPSQANYGSALTNGSGGSQGKAVFARSYVGLGSAVNAFSFSNTGTINGTSGQDALLGNFPPSTDGALRLSKMSLNEGAFSGSTSVPRAGLPGAYYCPQDKVSGYIVRGDFVTVGVRRFSTVSVSATSFTSTITSCGAGFFDITGPWR